MLFWWHAFHEFVMSGVTDVTLEDCVKDEIKFKKGYRQIMFKDLIIIIGIIFLAYKLINYRGKLTTSSYGFS